MTSTREASNSSARVALDGDPWARFEAGLERNAANHRPLSPLTFLARAAQTHPEHPALIHGDLQRTYRSFAERCRRLANALTRRGIGPGDVVSVLAPNVPCALEV